jgi:hypothetical protein
MKGMAQSSRGKRGGKMLHIAGAVETKQDKGGGR